MFSEKVAIVTGGASGIGSKTAELFGKNGAKVVVSDISTDEGKKTADKIQKSGGEAIFIKTDVSKPDDCEKLVKETLKQFGRLDYACNAAGISGEQNLISNYSIEGWHKVIDINLSGVFYCMKFEIPAMIKSGGGAIVNIASILGLVAFAGAPAYVASKHGVVGLSATAAVEYAKENIRVNNVGPGFIKTPMTSDFREEKELLDQIISLHPMGRLGEPDEVAELIIWLCSDKASFVTGAYYAVDGGYLAR